MNYYCAEKVRRKIFLVTVLLLAAALCLFCLLSGVSDSDVSASAADSAPDSGVYPYNYGGEGKTLDITVDSSYSTIYTTDLSFGGQAESLTNGFYRSGDVYSTSPIYIEKSGDDYRITSSAMANSTLFIDLPIPTGGQLAEAIADSMVKVTARFVFEWGVHTHDDGGEEACSFYYVYYTGRTIEGDRESKSTNYDVSFPCGPGPGEPEKAGTQSRVGDFVDMTSVNTSGTPFLRIVMTNFDKHYDFNISIRKMKVEIELQPISDANIETKSIEVIDSTGLRHPDAGVDRTHDEVKVGDIVVVSNVIQVGDANLEIDKNLLSSGATSPHGRFWRRLFLRGGTEEFLKSVTSNDLQRVYTYTDSNGDPVDLSSDHSGVKAAFLVVGGDAVLSFSSNIWRRTSVSGGSTENLFTRVNTVFIDPNACNDPSLKSNTFYNKYIGVGKSYFTDETAYVTDKDVNNNTVVKQINLGVLSVSPQFSETSLYVNGGDDGRAVYQGATQVIYYKTSVWTASTPPSSSGERSNGFMPDEVVDANTHIGVYCTVYPFLNADSSVVYGDLFLNMPVADAGLNTFEKSALFSIEFIAVDYVGNYTYHNKKYFIRVDVTDYSFTYNKTLNVDSGDNYIPDNEVSITFTTLDDNGVPRARTKTDPIFKRGDKVLAYVKFTSASLKKYALTNFNAQGYSINTERNEYDSSYRTSVIMSEGMPYTFEVNANFAEDPTLRVLRFTFKLRATISITGTSQNYTGSGKGVTVVVTYEGNRVIGSVSTTYSTERDGTYSSTLPVDVNTYYVRCELKGHRTYYAYQTATMTISPATPRISSVSIDAIDYGESLLKIDFDESLAPSVFNTSVHSLGSDGNYYYDRSYDGIYGYYKVNETRLSSSSNSYVKPNAGYLTIPISFVPIKTTLDGESNVVYLRDENGKFVRDGNYRQLDNISVEIKINYSTAVALVVDQAVDNVVTYEFDGTVKPVNYTITSTITDAYGNNTSETGLNLYSYSRVTYETVPTDGSTPITLDGAPVDAGTYNVVISLVTGGGCNYTGRFEYTLVVNKRSLSVEGYSGLTRFKFQQETPFTPIAYYGRGSGRIAYEGLNYSFTYYFYDGGQNMATSAVPERLVGEEEFFVGTGMPQYAGQYVAQVEIDETNYENDVDKFIRFDILQADATYDSMVITAPTVAFNSSARNAHVNYQQRLSAVILSSNQNTGVKFEYHSFQRNKIVYEAKKLDGRFVVTQRAFRGEGHETESAEDFLADTQSYAGYDVGRRIAYLYFIPDDNRNFLPVGRQTEIIVGKANYVLSDVTIDSITYGAAVSSIEDLTVSENVKISLGGGEYKVLDKTSETEGYVYSLVGVDSARVYPAGENYVVVRVTPFDTDRFAVLNETLILRVAKQELTVEYESDEGDYVVDGYRVYSYRYGGAARPAFRYQGVVNGRQVVFTDNQIQGQLTYLSLPGREIVSATAASLTPGDYEIVYDVVDDNYVGSITFGYAVTKDVLVVGSTPSIYNAEQVVSYGTQLSTARFYSGSMLASTTGATVEGTYAFRSTEGEKFTQTGVRRDYYLTFTPSDLSLYEVCEASDLKLTLVVAKTDLSASVEISIDMPQAGFVYGELSVESDLETLISYTTPIYTNGASYAYEQTEGYEKLQATVTIDGLPGSGYLPVGRYPVTVTISDPNYAGAKTDASGIVVTPRPAKIVLAADANGETNEKIFRNRNQSVSYALMTIDEHEEYTRVVTGESVVQTFSLNGNALRSAPIDIGKYDVLLSLRSDNYVADPLETTLTIMVDPAQIRVANLDQTYNIPRAVAVSLGLNDAMYTLGFVGEDLTEYSSLPTEAGRYEVHLYFSAEANNGYSGEVVYRENGAIRYLEIEKYIADIIVNDVVTVNYSGARNDLRPTTEPYGLNLIVEYRAEGSNVWTAEEVFDANSSDDAYHYVRFTVDEPNYAGSKIVAYHINRSALTIVTQPVFDTFVYNGDAQPAVLENGSVVFSDRIALDGEYSLDLSAISVLSVGKHRVTYTFVAYDNGVVDNNFRPATGQCDLTVVKRTIEQSDFVLGAVSGNVAEYNGNSFAVDAAVREGAVYDPDGANVDFRLVVYYDDNVNAPRDPGTYAVRVTVSSRNYQGDYVWDKDFIINKGKPQIMTKPSVKAGTTYSVGSVVDTTKLEVGTGRAIVRGVGTTISGDFSIQSTTLSKANYNDVEVLFTPNDTERFDPVKFTVTFFAVGENPLPGVTSGESWDGATITIAGQGQVAVEAVSDATVYYGAKLRTFTLRFAGDAAAVNYLNDFGVLAFADPDEIPNAGDTAVRVVYTPYGENADTYTIMNGTVTVRVEKATLSDAEIRVVSYLGLTRAESDFIIALDGEIVDLGGTAEYYSDAGRSVSIDSETVEAGVVTVYYRYVSQNYVDIEGVAEMRAVEKLYESNIEIGRFSKSYNGDPISYEELYIRIIDTSVTVHEEDVSLVVFRDGVRSEGIEVGEYTVVVYVENELVYGTRSVLFTITERDVSDEITLDNYSCVYGTVASPRVILDGAYINTAVDRVVIKYKKAGQTDASYNSNVPVRAGNYKVKVTVSGANYSGEKVFDFVVERLPVRLVADSVYTYRYGAAESISISFRSRDGADGVDLEYSVYYYSRSYSMSQTLPVNAGTYVARIVMEDDDYSINGALYAEVSYVIEQMTSSITTAPSPINVNADSHLVYGQSLSELGLYGGQATRNDVPIDGIFVVVDNGEKPDAGVYYATVRFIPLDKNYSEATTRIPILIGRASATVTFDKLQATYNGSSRRSALQYVVNPANVDVNIVFVNASGERLTNPVAAGAYSLIVTSNDPNYTVTSTLDRSGNTAIFTIAKASVRSIVAPRANPLTVGESVEKSSVVSGENYGLVYYEGFSQPVSGNFSFLERSYVFASAGTYEISYVFTPTDTNNFAEGRGTTEIVVNKANATITVSDFEFTYAGGFSYPTFTTYPANLTVRHDITFRPYDPTDENYIEDVANYVDVGTYEFHAWVEDENYSSARTEFRIIIHKKNIDLDFVDENGEVAQQYATTYGVTPIVSFALYPAGTPNKSGYLLKDETKNGVNITETYEIRYQSTDKNVAYDDHRPPTEIGTYTVTVTLVNGNYTAEKTVLYKINKGKIVSVTFDTDSVDNQVYGSVVDPIVLTEPSGVGYKIIYHGTSGGTRPTDAGSYDITVQFNDESYETMQIAAKFKIAKKSIYVTGITVSDKTYDGTPTLAVTGQLYGVLPGDEISLSMTAETVDGTSNVGTHYVRITSCKLHGLQSGNYELVYPTYALPIEIFDNKVTAAKGGSFITAVGGFDEGTTVEFSVVKSDATASTFFENLTGRTSKVIGYTVKENGADVLVEDAFKVYVEIPTEFLNADFEVKGVGALSDKNVVFSREGNYVTFYASSSGQVQFKKTEFSYTNVVVLIALGLVILAALCLVVITPMVNRRKISDNSAEKAYAKYVRRGY